MLTTLAPLCRDLARQVVRQQQCSWNLSSDGLLRSVGAAQIAAVAMSLFQSATAGAAFKISRLVLALQYCGDVVGALKRMAAPSKGQPGIIAAFKRQRSHPGGS